MWYHPPSLLGVAPTAPDPCTDHPIENQITMQQLTALERRAAVSLALVFAFRMLGLFMLIPVFAIYGQHLIGFSPLWIGLAIGAYGLTQAVLQIPMVGYLIASAAIR